VFIFNNCGPAFPVLCFPRPLFNAPGPLGFTTRLSHGNETRDQVCCELPNRLAVGRCRCRWNTVLSGVTQDELQQPRWWKWRTVQMGQTWLAEEVYLQARSKPC